MLSYTLFTMKPFLLLKQSEIAEGKSKVGPSINRSCLNGPSNIYAVFESKEPSSSFN